MLSRLSSRIVQCRCAWVNSSSACAPFRNRPVPFSPMNGSANAEQLAQRRAGPRRHHVRRESRDLLDPLGVDGDPVQHPAIQRDLAQEGALALVGIQEVDPPVGHDGEDQPGKAGAGAEVDQRSPPPPSWGRAGVGEASEDSFGLCSGFPLPNPPPAWGRGFAGSKGTSWALSRKWRRQRSGRVAGPTRLILACHFTSRPA